MDINMNDNRLDLNESYNNKTDSSERIKALDSVKILDGFHSVLEQFSKKMDLIKIEASNRNKEIGKQRKEFDDELGQHRIKHLQSTEK